MHSLALVFSPLPSALSAATPQAGAEYMGVSAESALRSLERLGGQVSSWIGQNPMIVWVGLALLLFMFIATRSKTP